MTAGVERLGADGPGLRPEQLRGFRIGVTSDRRSGDLIAALERRGAQVLHAPALRIAPNDQDGALIAETRALINARPDVVLVTTGYGMRRWFEVADAAGLGAELTAVMESARIMARGPKALGAVRAAGLDDAGMSDQETTASLVDKVLEEDWVGQKVAIQLHGYTDEVQLARLREASQAVFTVTPYRWVKPDGNERLPRLIDDVCHRQLDAITFTSAPAADATLATARHLGLYDEFLDALEHDVVAAAVGPVTGTPLVDAGVRPIMPERYRMGALIRLVCEHLDQHRVERFRTDHAEIELRGRCITVINRSLPDPTSIMLGPNALALFRRLAAAEGGVVSRRELVDSLPDAPDDHALEVAISRLRRSLTVPGVISTVVKRGYRLAASRSAGLT
ncbi:MAG TPA: uroporphyrinogen-III synthase [Propionibacteriaceae bacterium]|nr:uroporphyrinogen-III synthase [Propionibacteriaceae bacterium]